MKKILSILSLSSLLLSLAACGPSAPLPTGADGKPVAGDKGISGAVTGSDVGANTKVAVFGAFTNVGSGNKIDTNNKTIEKDITLATAPVSAGKYTFALPKAPQKAQGASFKVFAFNDANGNSMFDEGEAKSKEATILWAVGVGYTLAQDADGNNVATINDFQDFDFKLGE
ncbi:MAG: hypothetical protein ACO1RX_14170 [Candidatus Sericytochromatia bacterium]